MRERLQPKTSDPLPGPKKCGQAAGVGQPESELATDEHLWVLTGIGQRLEEAMNARNYKVAPVPRGKKQRPKTSGITKLARDAGTAASTVMNLLDGSISYDTAVGPIIRIAGILRYSVGWLLAQELPKTVEELNPDGTRYRPRPRVGARGPVRVARDQEEPEPESKP